MAKFVIKEIDITLDPKSIEKALAEIVSLQSVIQEFSHVLCERLLKEGVEVAKTSLRSYGAGGGALEDSIHQVVYDREKGIGYIIAGEGEQFMVGSREPLVSYAMFVEWGTPKGSAKKKTDEDRYGFFQPSLKLPVGAKKEPEEKKRSWVYYNKARDHWYTSYGQPPKPFMHDTFTRLHAIANLQSATLMAEIFPEQYAAAFLTKWHVGT